MGPNPPGGGSLGAFYFSEFNRRPHRLFYRRSFGANARSLSRDSSDYRRNGRFLSWKPVVAASRNRNFSGGRPHDRRREINFYALTIPTWARDPATRDSF